MAGRLKKSDDARMIAGGVSGGLSDQCISVWLPCALRISVFQISFALLRDDAPALKKLGFPL